MPRSSTVRMLRNLADDLEGQYEPARRLREAKGILARCLYYVRNPVDGDDQERLIKRIEEFLDPSRRDDGA